MEKFSKYLAWFTIIFITVAFGRHVDKIVEMLGNMK